MTGSNLFLAGLLANLHYMVMGGIWEGSGTCKLSVDEVRFGEVSLNFVLLSFQIGYIYLR